MLNLMHNNNGLFLQRISEQDQEISPCSCSGLSLQGKSHVLVRCSHTVTGLRTLFLFLPFLDLLWRSQGYFPPVIFIFVWPFFVNSTNFVFVLEFVCHLDIFLFIFVLYIETKIFLCLFSQKV